MRPVGSSPHTRGAPTGHQAGISQSRIIPAYAGSTGNGRGPEIPRRDHPRIRGEHLGDLPDGHARVGSSPHTRGAPGIRTPQERSARIIPAYAGSTIPGFPRASGRPDHPRIRGEHLDHRHPPGAGAGSSPHTRGARARGRGRRAGAGIIPAYAGSTTAAAAKQTPRRDHPRIRGEHLRGGPALGLPLGSSPHTRGALLGWAPCRGLRRIIPAYAGSTTGSVGFVTSHWDHPRIRGEHREWARSRNTAAGSSPHTRGAPLWFIPHRTS